jgi:hypothetical protein
VVLTVALRNMMLARTRRHVAKSDRKDSDQRVRMSVQPNTGA